MKFPIPGMGAGSCPAVRLGNVVILSRFLSSLPRFCGARLPPARARRDVTPFECLNRTPASVIQTLGEGTKSVLDADERRKRLMERSGCRKAAHQSLHTDCISACLRPEAAFFRIPFPACQPFHCLNRSSGVSFVDRHGCETVYFLACHPWQNTYQTSNVPVTIRGESVACRRPLPTG